MQQFNCIQHIWARCCRRNRVAIVMTTAKLCLEILQSNEPSRCNPSCTLEGERKQAHARGQTQTDSISATHQDANTCRSSTAAASHADSSSRWCRKQPPHHQHHQHHHRPWKLLELPSTHRSPHTLSHTHTHVHAHSSALHSPLTWCRRLDNIPFARFEANYFSLSLVELMVHSALRINNYETESVGTCRKHTHTHTEQSLAFLSERFYVHLFSLSFYAENWPHPRAPFLPTQPQRCKEKDYSAQLKQLYEAS